LIYHKKLTGEMSVMSETMLIRVYSSDVISLAMNNPVCKDIIVFMAIEDEIPTPLLHSGS
jgi:hypothetical protein